MLLIVFQGCSQTDLEPQPVAESASIADPIDLPLPAEEILPPARPDAAVYPSTEQWEEAGPRQRARAERSFAELQQRKVPAYGGPLFVEDDLEVRLQDPQEVARRAVILWAVALKAESTPQKEAIDLIRRDRCLGQRQSVGAEIPGRPQTEPRTFSGNGLATGEPVGHALGTRLCRPTGMATRDVQRAKASRDHAGG